MKMTVQDALNAAHDAETEGLLGKYPMAAQVLAQELNHHVAKNALLTPEVQRSQDKCRELWDRVNLAETHVAALQKELTALKSKKADMSFLDEALNSGDGTYKP